MSRCQYQATAELLRSLFEATASATGEEFFRALARYLAEALETRFSIVSELVEKGKTARTLAFWADGNFLDNMEYNISGTPCELVLSGEIVQINENLHTLYPSETMFGEPLESYLGIPLVGRTGEILGHVVAMDDKPMVEKTRDFSTFEVFAIRATAELERLRAEKALNLAQLWLIQAEKMAALGQLTAGVTHEINSPIGVIQSNNDLMLRSINKLRRALERSGGSSQPVENEAQEHMRAIQRFADANSAASERIANVLENLKRFSRVDEAPYQMADIHEGIDSALDLLKPHLWKKEAKVIKGYGNIPKIRSDPSELNQVFMTLLKNANDAIQDKGTIAIRTSSDDEHVYVKVSDSGRGMPEDQLPTLFDVGFAMKGSKVGMRMGLPTAFSIIKNHDGRISVTSQVGKGTEFTIQLPIRQDNGT